MFKIALEGGLVQYILLMDGYHAGIRKTSHAMLGSGKPTDLTNHRFLRSMFVNCEWCGCMILAFGFSQPGIRCARIKTRVVS